MDILITQWALDSYLELMSKNMLTQNEFKTVVEPDVRRLHKFPNDPKFKQDKFWSEVMRNGYKMKWHQIGEGRNQLRLTVGIFGRECSLCGAYIKQNQKQELRQLAKFKTYLQLIRENCYTICGRLRHDKTSA